MKPSETIEALGELHAADSPTRLIDWALNDLGSRFGSEFAVWTQITPRGEMRSARLAEGIGAGVWQYGPVIQHHLAADHPVLRQYVSTGARRLAGRLTDFASQNAFDRSGLCREAYRHLGMRRQLALIFQGPDGGVCTFGFGRNGSDFSRDQSRAAAELTLHLQLSLGRLWHMEARERDARSNLSARFRAIRIAGIWYFAFVDESTANLVLKHFGKAETFVVPDRLARHFPAAGGVPQSVTDFDGTNWTLIFSGRSRDEAVIALRRGQPRLGKNSRLTPREAEILQWVAQGKRDVEIAMILGISPRTVSKHVEHILAKLGVETRGAAVAAAGR